MIAASGGPDSQALLHVLARLREELGIQLKVLGVDHGLRAEAAAELKWVEQLAGSLGVSMEVARVSVSPGGNLQARARQARHAALLEALARWGGTWIATGHHAEDRAETVMMRLLHGGTARGLACLPAREGCWVRPLLLAKRSDVLLHLNRHEISFAEDPSNRDTRFLRARLRWEVMPKLQELSPQLIEHLNSLADELAAVPGCTTKASDSELDAAEPQAMNQAAGWTVQRELAPHVMDPGSSFVGDDPTAQLQIATILQRGTGKAGALP